MPDTNSIPEPAPTGTTAVAPWYSRVPLIARQPLLLALAALCLWWGLSSNRCGIEKDTLWPAALGLWVSLSMFVFGWWNRDLKAQLYLALGWVGVASAAAVIAIFIGAAVAVTGNQTAIRITVALVMLGPPLILPRYAVLWPDNRPASGLIDHAIRFPMVLAQYAGIALLIASIMRFCPEVPGT